MFKRETRVFEDNFDRAQVLVDGTPGHNGWSLDDVSSSGAPTATTATLDGGGMVLTLAATSEAENLTMFMEDILMFDVRNLQHVDIIAHVAGIDSLSVVCFGVGAAQNDDEDAVVTNAWFKMEGATSTTLVVVETDDGTNDNNDIATGVTLAATPKFFRIDFTRGISDIRFYIDGEPVALPTTFSMADLTAGLNVQPYVQISKPSGTGTPAVTIRKFRIQYTSTLGA